VLIRRRADFDSLAFPKRDESESLVQTGGLQCDQGFLYVTILMEIISGGWRGRTGSCALRARSRRPDQWQGSRPGIAVERSATCDSSAGRVRWRLCDLALSSELLPAFADGSTAGKSHGGLTRTLARRRRHRTRRRCRNGHSAGRLPECFDM